MLIGVQVQEQLLDLVHDLGDPRVGAIDLVDDQDHRQASLERLAQHEARLRQRSFARVDQQQDAIDHREGAFDLTPEVGMAGRIDDVDLDVAVLHGRVLGQDRDALLALQIHGVHHPLRDVLVLSERARLPQHGVHQGGLTVVDVSHDGHVPDVVAGRHAELLVERGDRRTPATISLRP